MRGSNYETISPFILFSVHNGALDSTANDLAADKASRSLTRQEVPFKRVRLCSKGGKIQEHQFIVDITDDLAARQLAAEFGQDTLVSVDLNRVGTRVFVNKFDTGSFILGVIGNVLEHTLEPGDVYLKDEAGTCWAWS